MYSRDKDASYDRMSGEKLRSGEIPRLEGLECYGDSRGCLDLLGQKIVGDFGLGRGLIFHLLQIQKCGRWRDLGVYRGLWPFLQRRKGVFVGGDWGN